MAQPDISIRLSLKDGDLVKRGLEQLGDEGKRALEKIEAAAKGPSPELRALDAGVKGLRVQFDGLADRLGPFGAALRAIGPVGLAASAVIAGIGIAARSTFATLAEESKKASALVDVADKVGLSVERLQEYRFAAREAGVETGDFDRALEVLARRAGEARDGTGELLALTRRYNIELKDGNGQARTTEALYRDIAAAVRNAGDQQERLAIVNDAFGRGAGNMVLLLRDGADGLDRQAAAARQLGVVLSEQAARGAKDLSDQLERLSQIRDTAKLETLFGNAGEVTESFKNLEEAARITGKLSAMWDVGVANALVFTFKTLPDAIADFAQSAERGYVPAADAIADANREVADTTEAVVGNLFEGAKAFDQLRQKYEDLIKDTDKAAAIEAKRSERLKLLNALIANGVITTDEAARAQALVNAEYAREIEINEKRGETQRTVNDRLAEQVARNHELLAALRVSGREGAVVARTQEIMAQGFKGSAAEARALAEQLLEQEALIGGLQSAWREAGAAAKDTIETEIAAPLTRALENTVDGIKDSFDDLWFDVFRHGRLSADDFLGNLYDAFARTLAEMATLAIANPIILPMVAGAGRALGLPAGQIDQLGRGFGVNGLSSLAGGGFNAAALTTSLFPGVATSAFGQSLGLSTVGSAAGNGFAVGAIPGMTGLTGAPSTPLLTGLGRGFNTLTSPAGLLGGIAGSTLASLLFTPRKGPGNEIGGALGAIAGSFIPVPFLGTAIGSFIGSALGGLFGAKPSDRQEGQILNLRTGAMRDVGFTGAKDSAENTQAVQSFIDAAKGLKDLLESRTGAKVGIDEIDYRVGDRSGISLRVGADSGTFASAEGAFAFVVEKFVGSLEGAAPRVQRAVEKIDFANLEFAASQLDLVLNFEDAVKQLSESIDPESEVQAALRTIRANFDDLADQLDDLGYTQDEVFGLRDAALGRLREDFNRNLGDQVLALRDPQAYAFLLLDREFDTLRKDAADLGADLVKIEELYGLRRTEIVERFAERSVDALDEMAAAAERAQDLIRETAEAQADAVEDQARAARSLFDAMTARARTLTGVLTQLDLDPSLSLLTPEALFSATSARFDDAAARARLGDEDALDELGELGVGLVEMAKQMYGSTGQTVAVQSRVRDAVTAARDTAARHAGVAERQLGVLEAQLIELRRIASGQNPATGESATPGPAATAADFAALTRAYGDAGAPTPGSAAFGVFESALLNLVGRAQDPDLIRLNVAQQTARLNDPVFGGSAQRILNAFLGRAQDLGIPGFAAGGFHAGGLAFTGESGVELKAHGPARFYSPAQTREMLTAAQMSTAELTQHSKAAAWAATEQVTEARALRGEVARLGNLIQTLLDKRGALAA
ncbi:MAG: hypothetical protein SFV21_00260 [Rhodospirillaceae bacterium]|nr:hypothetical protein [Rhodospirillaceae bacterium]